MQLLCPKGKNRVQTKDTQNPKVNQSKPSKSRKDKSRFRVSNIPYKIQDAERNMPNSSII